MSSASNMKLWLLSHDLDSVQSVSVPPTMKFCEIFSTFSDRLHSDSLRGVFDGEILGMSQTPELVGMREGDLIDLFCGQLGGSGEGGEVAEPTITITVRDATGNEMNFKVKKTTKFEKIFAAYASRLGIQAASIRFTYDGEAIHENQTPKMLELEDNDQIDARIQQVGGGEGVEGGESTESTITITVKDATGNEMNFKVKKTTKFEKIFAAYASRLGIQPTAIRFTLDGERVLPDQTPKFLEMEDGDQIDARIEQTGGGEGEDEAITISVNDDGVKTVFKIKKTTKFIKVFQAFADRKGVDLGAIRFLLDGRRIGPEDTPKFLEMEEGDQIDVMSDQQGGALFCL